MTFLFPLYFLFFIQNSDALFFLPFFSFFYTRFQAGQEDLPQPRVYDCELPDQETALGSPSPPSPSALESVGGRLEMGDLGGGGESLLIPYIDSTD